MIDWILFLVKWGVVCWAALQIIIRYTNPYWLLRLFCDHTEIPGNPYPRLSEVMINPKYQIWTFSRQTWIGWPVLVWSNQHDVTPIIMVPFGDRIGLYYIGNHSQYIDELAQDVGIFRS